MQNRGLESPIRVPKRSQLFIRTHNETLSVAKIALESFLIAGWRMMPP
jgi:hypothetical protein